MCSAQCAPPMSEQPKRIHRIASQSVVSELHLSHVCTTFPWGGWTVKELICGTLLSWRDKMDCQGLRRNPFLLLSHVHLPAFTGWVGDRWVVGEVFYNASPNLFWSVSDRTGKIESITFKYYISKILVKWVLLQMWKCVPDMECGSPSSSYMDDRQARFRARVKADRFASTLPYMWFLTRLWKVLLIECCNMWTWNTTFTHGLRSLAWLPDKIEWVERDDGVCVIASQPFLNLHSEHFKVKTKEMLLPDKWWSSLRADASRSNQQM